MLYRNRGRGKPTGNPTITPRPATAIPRPGTGRESHGSSSGTPGTKLGTTASWQLTLKIRCAHATSTKASPISGGISFWISAMRDGCGPGNGLLIGDLETGKRQTWAVLAYENLTCFRATPFRFLAQVRIRIYAKSTVVDPSTT
jgi:hypothetical protein